MAKRSKNRFSNLVEDKEEVIPVEVPENEFDSILEELQANGLDIPVVDLYTKVEQSKSKRLQSIYPAHLKITGRASGKLYEWAMAGSVVEVDVEDVEELLQKRIGGSSCCGAVKSGNQLLQLVEEV